MTLDQIWHEYRAGLNAFLHSKLSNPDDVDDLLQEILLKSYLNLASLKDAASIKAWLFQIANRSVIDFYRKNGRIKDEPLWLSEDEETQDDTVKTALSLCVLPFINELPDDKARLLRAIELEGVSQKNYAEQLNIPYTTLKSQVKKARSELKVLFDQCCHFQQDKFGNLIDYEKKPDACNRC